jgi:hypothetical protein
MTIQLVNLSEKDKKRLFRLIAFGESLADHSLPR